MDVSWRKWYESSIDLCFNLVKSSVKNQFPGLLFMACNRTRFAQVRHLVLVSPLQEVTWPSSHTKPIPNGPSYWASCIVVTALDAMFHFGNSTWETCHLAALFPLWETTSAEFKVISHWLSVRTTADREQQTAGCQKGWGIGGLLGQSPAGISELQDLCLTAGWEEYSYRNIHYKMLFILSWFFPKYFKIPFFSKKNKALRCRSD